MLVPEPRPPGVRPQQPRHCARARSCSREALPHARAGGRQPRSTGRVATSPNAYDDIVAELDAGDYDEIILETPPSHVSHWLHVDLAERIAHLGYPLPTVAASH